MILLLSPTACPEGAGFSQSLNRCYKLFEIGMDNPNVLPMPYDDAALMCAEEEGQLTSINSDEEQLHVQNV